MSEQELLKEAELSYKEIINSQVICDKNVEWVLAEGFERGYVAASQAKAKELADWKSMYDVISRREQEKDKKVRELENQIDQEKLVFAIDSIDEVNSIISTSFAFDFLKRRTAYVKDFLESLRSEK